jgi:hypothetical protein
MARMLWAFDVEAGVVDEETGRRHEVHDMDCTEGFVTLPKPLRAFMRPRGEWVRDRILERGVIGHKGNNAFVYAIDAPCR